MSSMANALGSSSTDEEKIAMIIGIATALDDENSDVHTLTEHLRSSGCVSLIVDLLDHKNPDIHQPAMLLMGNLSSDAVDPQSAKTKAILKVNRAIDKIIPHLFEDDVVMLLYTVGALQNLITDIEYVKRMDDARILHRLVQIRDAGDEQLEQYVRGIMHNMQQAVMQHQRMTALVVVKAVVRLQALVRGHRQREALLAAEKAKAAIELKAAERIQATARGHTARKDAKTMREERLRAAATKVQKTVRMKLARMEAAAMKAVVAEAGARRAAVAAKWRRGKYEARLLAADKKAAASTKLQSGFRGHLAREEHRRRKRIRDAKRAVLAAIRLQAMHRGKHARREVQTLVAARKAKREAMAASHITAKARGRQARVLFRAMRLSAKQAAAASQLAAVARGRHARVEVKAMRAERWRLAATKLQRTMRMKLAHMEVVEMKAVVAEAAAEKRRQLMWNWRRAKEQARRDMAIAKRKAATKLQCLARSHFARAQLKQRKLRQLKAALVMQSFGRQCLARAELRRRKQAAVVAAAATRIQAVVRSKLSRYAVAVARLQSRWRGTLSRRRVVKLRAERKAAQEAGAATRLQAVSRGRKGRAVASVLVINRRETAALKVQSMSRCRLARKKVQAKAKQVKFDKEVSELLFMVGGMTQAWYDEHEEDDGDFDLDSDANEYDLGITPAAPIARSSTQPIARWPPHAIQIAEPLLEPAPLVRSETNYKPPAPPVRAIPHSTLPSIPLLPPMKTPELRGPTHLAAGPYSARASVGRRNTLELDPKTHASNYLTSFTCRQLPWGAYAICSPRGVGLVERAMSREASVHTLATPGPLPPVQPLHRKRSSPRAVNISSRVRSCRSPKRAWAQSSWEDLGLNSLIKSQQPDRLLRVRKTHVFHPPPRIASYDMSCKLMTDECRVGRA